MNTRASLLLASKSPRRRELLEQVGVDFQVLAVDIAEVPRPGERSDDYVCRLAQEKARAGAQQVPGRPVLGADTLGVYRNRILEKPGSREDALTMLRSMSGDVHQVYSAVSICCDERQYTRLSVTEVTFRPLSLTEIERYWETGEPQDKAGAYAIQGLGAMFVERIEGSYSGVVGLPLNETRELLEMFDIPWWQIQQVADSAGDSK